MKKIFFVLFVLIMSSCSSSAKNPGDIDNIRKMAEQELNLGNKAAGQGQFENALFLLTEAKRKAVSVDDASLIIRTSLSRGNVLLSLGQITEAFSEWDHAIKEAQRIGDAELLSASRIFRVRGELLTASDAALRTTANTVLDLVIKEQAKITHRYFTAFSWQVRGLALRALGSYAEAENAVKRSLEIHEKDKYLENASYDWYIIASVRSLQGNFTGAISALESSMAIDRRIENSWGLAASWKAMGDVLVKTGRKDEADLAYERHNAILNAMGAPAPQDTQ